MQVVRTTVEQEMEVSGGTDTEEGTKLYLSNLDYDVSNSDIEVVLLFFFFLIRFCYMLSLFVSAYNVLRFGEISMWVKRAQLWQTWVFTKKQKKKTELYIWYVVGFQILRWGCRCAVYTYMVTILLWPWISVWGLFEMGSVFWYSLCNLCRKWARKVLLEPRLRTCHFMPPVSNDIFGYALNSSNLVLLGWVIKLVCFVAAFEKQSTLIFNTSLYSFVLFLWFLLVYMEMCMHGVCRVWFCSC